MISRRDVLRWALLSAAMLVRPEDSIAVNGHTASVAPLGGKKIKETAFAYIRRRAREDGGYSTSADPSYKGRADTQESDLAAMSYAATLAKPEGWELPHLQKSVDFIQRHQRPDGTFVNLAGTFDPKSDIAILYNTTQGVVSLRALGEKPRINPAKVTDRFFKERAFTKLPWYTMSFYPLFYAALGVEFPNEYKAAIRRHLIENQAADGYLGDHVASTFHLVHFFRLIGEPTPEAAGIVHRVLRDQQSDGGWRLKNSATDVHACFDAVFILR
ncbi:MAG: prenyltransferase/squalene oxidase repeat-containing protein, partial [Acidobacteriaceae bacterium]